MAARKVSVMLDITAANDDDEDGSNVVALVTVGNEVADLTWQELSDLHDDIGATLDAYAARRGG